MMFRWDDIYQSEYDWGADSGSAMLLQLVGLVSGSGKRVLDMGAGVGRNAFLFASKGTHIDCVDISRVALNEIASRSASLDATIDVHCTDLRNFSLAGQAYDLVICYGVINALPKRDWRPMAEAMAASLTVGGMLAITAFTNINQHRHTTSPTIVDLAAPAEMLELFPDMRILWRDSRMFEHTHYPSGSHEHVIERYIFKKEHEDAGPRLSSPERPRLAVLGPTNPIYSSHAVGVPVSRYYEAARRLGRFLADHRLEFVGLPDEGFSRTCFEAMFEKEPLGRATLLAPSGTTELSNNVPGWLPELRGRYKSAQLNVVEGLSWPEQVVKISQLADACVVGGLSCGGIAEIAWTKWTRKPVFHSLDLCSKLPKEILSMINCFECGDFAQLLTMLESQLPHLGTPPGTGQSAPPPAARTSTNVPAERLVADEAEDTKRHCAGSARWRAR